MRLLVYRNQERMGRFANAIAAFALDRAKSAANCQGFHDGSKNPAAPDLCWVPKDDVKVGIGLHVEQAVAEDVGVFLRAMSSDGNTEVYSYASTDRSLSFGSPAEGKRWHRPLDAVGVGLAFGWISAVHAGYLQQGGVDGFVGDGTLHAAPESALDVFYRGALTPWLWATADYQLIVNPGFNADRGPVNVFGARVHGKF